MPVRLLLALATLFLAILSPVRAADSVYDQVAAELAKHPHRQPGSPELWASAGAIEKALSTQGVTVNRQLYRTLVQRTRSCVLSVDGVVVPGVLPLGPNGAAPTTTWGKEISGRPVYLGDGQAPRLDGKIIAGSIAVLDLGSDALRDVLSLGARAVVFVGDQASQWQAATACTELNVSVPRVWMSRAAAEKSGLLDGRIASASLRIDTAWEHVDTANLWLRIPAAENASAEEKAQTLVVSATLDTTGLVPDFNPQGRWAANCALLADTAARLAADRPNRNVVVVFFGSHYIAEDGARFFYDIVNRTILGSRDTNPLSRRQASFAAEGEALARLIAEVDNPALVRAETPGTFALVQRLRHMLVGKVNNLNFEIRTIQLARRDLLDRGRMRPDQLDEAGRTRMAALDARDQATIAVKSALNGLRRQLFERTITDPTSFQSLLTELRVQLESEAASARRLAAEASSALPLFAALNGTSVIAHIGFDFADAKRPWLLNPTLPRSVAYQEEPGAGVFGKQLRAAGSAFAAMPRESQVAPLFVPDSAVTYQPSNLCTPRPLMRSQAAPMALGIFGAQCQTIGDPLAADEMPIARTWDLEPLAVQSAAFLRSLAAGEFPAKTGQQVSRFYNEKLVASVSGGTWRGLKLVSNSMGSEEIEGVAQRAMAVISPPSIIRTSPHPGALVGASVQALAWAEPNGYCNAPGILDLGKATSSQLNAIGFAPGGWIDRITEREKSDKFQARLFYAFGGGVLTTFTPDSYVYPAELKAINARTDAEPKHKFFEWGFDGHIVWADDDRPLKLFQQGLMILDVPAETKDRAERNGRGIPLDPATLISLDTTARSAADFAALNHQRMQVLRSKDLINKPVERLQADADDQLEQAAAARAAGNGMVASAHDTAAMILANRACKPLRETANDLLKGVVILLILAIPFAFAAERLVFGSPNIYKQILGFSGIFCATFGILYLTHPAFALASAPIVIFLAFVIILLSGFVIAVVMGKFKHELKAMQGMEANAHGGNKGDSPAFAAVIIGISGMRNRPLKTFLTVVTVTLLTFTILVFASFESTLGVQETYLGRGRGAERIELHLPSFQNIPQRLVRSIDIIYGDRFEVASRSASFADPANQGVAKAVAQVLWNPERSTEVKLDAVVGLQPNDAARLQGLFPALSQGDAPIYLSQSVAKLLDVAVGAPVQLRGKPFTVAGFFDESALVGIENIDGSRLTPPNFEATFASLNITDETAKRNALASIDPGMFIFTQPGQIAVTTTAALKELSPTNNFVVLYPKSGADTVAAARELAVLFNAPVFANTADGATKFFYTQVVSGSGYLEVLVPLLLGGLIIFSSLLGSIVDRQKEIFTFSALGLAPRHVGFLFFAESAVIAVLGGLGGYLVSQLVVKLLGFLASHGLATVPALNFSSFSSIITILIVMAMVLLSTIYPALMASRSANPGVNRSWKMPKPEGETLTFTFPFTVPAKSFGGILGFIREHFEAHGDASLDVFSAKRIEIERTGDGKRLAISAHIALSPFDLGVLQRFRMHTRPSDIEGIDEVVVELTHLNGAPGTWLKGNRSFVANLREQFLLWRSLPPETVEHYQQSTATALAAADLLPAREANHG